MQTRWLSMDERLEPIIEDLRETYDFNVPEDQLVPSAEGLLSALESLQGRELSKEEVEEFFVDDGEDDDPYTGVAI